MPNISAPHGPIEYAVEGEGRPLVLICGLGSQMIRWSPEFRQTLVGHGFQVIRFDNRDTGLSRNYADGPTPDLKAVFRLLRSGGKPDLAYRLTDLADDVVLLLDHLGVQRAHILGVSMGGFIAQHLAARHPERVDTLTLVMTSTGNPALPPPSAEAQAFMAKKGGDEAGAGDLVEQAIANALVICSPAYPPDPVRLRARVAAEIERAHLPSGYVRQRAAILADGDRSAIVKGISAPTLVIHGTADPLIPHEGGEELAALIPGAQLRLIEGMGHEIPEALAAGIAAAVAELAKRPEAAG